MLEVGPPFCCLGWPCCLAFFSDQCVEKDREGKRFRTVFICLCAEVRTVVSLVGRGGGGRSISASDATYGETMECTLLARSSDGHVDSRAIILLSRLNWK